MNLALVMLGGAVGAGMRYFLSLRFGSFLFIQSSGVLLANGLGCFFLGILNTHPNTPLGLKHFASIGLLGALTTFSSFIAEAFSITEKNPLHITLFFILCHLATGGISYTLGSFIGKSISHG